VIPWRCPGEGKSRAVGIPAATALQAVLCELFFHIYRRPGTVNRNEVVKIIRRTFADRLDIDEEDLIRDAALER